MGRERQLNGPATIPNTTLRKGHLYLTMIISILQAKALALLWAYVGGFAGLVVLVNLLGWIIERMCRR